MYSGQEKVKVILVQAQILTQIFCAKNDDRDVLY